MAQKTRAVRAADIASRFADNTSRSITPLKQRDAQTDALDSTPLRVSGAVVPGSAPEAVGDLYVNTAAETAYVSIDTADATDWEQLAFLSVLAAATGAALVGIEDTAGDFTATNVETALAELKADISGLGGGGGFTQEQIEDFVGLMVTGNTETLVTVTYQDADGTFDFVVNNDLSLYDNSTSAFLSAGDIGATVQAYDVDTLKADTSDDLTAGYTSTSYDAGTQASGTFTPDPALRNIQHYINGGAHTLAPPASDCSMSVQVTNNASAGTIVTSGFSAVKGDPLTTTNGDDFILSINVNNGISILSVAAAQ